MKLQLKYSENLQTKLERAIAFCGEGHIYVNKKKEIIYIETADLELIHSRIRRDDIIPNKANITTLAKYLML